MARFLTTVLSRYLMPRMGAFIIFAIPAYLLHIFSWQPPQLRFVGGILILAVIYRFFGIRFWSGIWDAFLLFVVVGAVFKFFGNDIFEVDKVVVPFFQRLSETWSASSL